MVESLALSDLRSLELSFGLLFSAESSVFGLLLYFPVLRFVLNVVEVLSRFIFIATWVGWWLILTFCDLFVSGSFIFLSSICCLIWNSLNLVIILSTILSFILTNLIRSSIVFLFNLSNTLDAFILMISASLLTQVTVFFLSVSSQNISSRPITFGALVKNKFILIILILFFGFLNLFEFIG